MDTYQPGSRYARWIRGQRCCVPLCFTPGEPHHARPRGAGGKDSDLVPLCRLHHEEGHTIGWQTWEDRYGLNLRAVADLLHQAYLTPRPVE